MAEDVLDDREVVLTSIDSSRSDDEQFVRLSGGNVIPRKPIAERSHSLSAFKGGFTFPAGCGVHNPGVSVMRDHEMFRIATSCNHSPGFKGAAQAHKDDPESQVQAGSPGGSQQIRSSG